MLPLLVMLAPVVASTPEPVRAVAVIELLLIKVNPVAALTPALTPLMVPPTLLVMVALVPAASKIPWTVPELIAPALVMVEPVPTVSEIPWAVLELITPVAVLVRVVAADAVTPALLFVVKAVKLPELLSVKLGKVMLTGEEVPALPVSVLFKTTVIVPAGFVDTRVSAKGAPATVV